MFFFPMKWIKFLIKFTVLYQLGKKRAELIFFSSTFTIFYWNLLHTIIAAIGTLHRMHSLMLFFFLRWPVVGGNDQMLLLLLLWIFDSLKKQKRPNDPNSNMLVYAIMSLIIALFFSLMNRIYCMFPNCMFRTEEKPTTIKWITVRFLLMQPQPMQFQRKHISSESKSKSTQQIACMYDSSQQFAIECVHKEWELEKLTKWII